MTVSLLDSLPDVLQHVQTKPLFVMRLTVRPLQVIGATPGAYRRVGVLKTADNALIGMTCRGLRHGPPDVIARLEKGEVKDPANYYFRIAAFFEAQSPQYAWLNNVIGVGLGHRFAEGPVYSVFEIL